MKLLTNLKKKIAQWAMKTLKFEYTPELTMSAVTTNFIKMGAICKFPKLYGNSPLDELTVRQKLSHIIADNNDFLQLIKLETTLTDDPRFETFRGTILIVKQEESKWND